VVRLSRGMATLCVNEQAMCRNLEASKELVVAEPLYILLAMEGYQPGYERMRALAREAREHGHRLMDLAQRDPEIGPILEKLPEEQRQLLNDPARYTGQACARTLEVCETREQGGAQLLDLLQKERDLSNQIRHTRVRELVEEIRSQEVG